eukprot:jgi/Chlat1/7063/Chrsp56S00529
MAAAAVVALPTPGVGVARLQRHADVDVAPRRPGFVAGSRVKVATRRQQWQHAWSLTTGVRVSASANASQRVDDTAADKASKGLLQALLFDCDGVLVDTERDGHRVSFNQAFAEKGLETEWGVELYGDLLKIGGGKERMTHFFNKVGWPSKAGETDEQRQAFVAGLHKLKTQLFMDLIENRALALRPGCRLIDEAITAGVPVAVCSTSNEKAVGAIVRELLGSARADVMQIFAGDVVPKKKPDPAIYNLAAEKLSVDPSRCVVIEDSEIGLKAAKAAGMTCIITKSGYTGEENFESADAVFDCIGDGHEARFSLSGLVHFLEASAAATS